MPVSASERDSNAGSPWIGVLELERAVNRLEDGRHKVQANAHAGSLIVACIRVGEQRLSRVENPDAVANDEPSISVRVSHLESALEQGFVVEDDGRGIPSASRELVFERGQTTSEDGNRIRPRHRT